MKRSIYGFGLALAGGLAANGAAAEPCEGVNARRAADPVVVHQGRDGSVTMLISSTGSSTTTRPVTAVRWQKCSGLWTIDADKTGSGSGHCYSVDGDGDQWVISWEGGDDGGTWAHQRGTGKYANLSAAKGTWEYGERYPDGLRLTTWSGDCGI